MQTPHTCQRSESCRRIPKRRAGGNKSRERVPVRALGVGRGYLLFSRTRRATQAKKPIVKITSSMKAMPWGTLILENEKTVSDDMSTPSVEINANHVHGEF